MPNVLTNMPVETWKEASIFYNEFFWDSRHIPWQDDYGHFRRLKMVADQYHKYRAKVKKFTTLLEILFWMNDCHEEILMVPMNLVDNRRKPIAPRSVDINQVFQDPDINTTFRFFESSEEAVIGEGWTGEMIVMPPMGKRFDADAWRFGLASYGIYTMPGLWEDKDGRNLWTFRFHILERDFRITDAEGHRWSWVDPIDEISEWEDACSRAEEIEDGYADYEVFGDGYAR